MARRENDVESIFVLHGNKSAHVLSPPEFLSNPPLELGLTKNSGALGQKFSQPINFNYEFFYILKYIKKLNSPLCGPFSLHNTSKGRQVERLPSQG